MRTTLAAKCARDATRGPFEFAESYAHAREDRRGILWPHRAGARVCARTVPAPEQTSFRPRRARAMAVPSLGRLQGIRRGIASPSPSLPLVTWREV